ncbi:hypothetical protein A9Q99_21430 [Gammaproteobacteria bacterium 45_16_T64]|nr:hypothetical protein A9Q99_21430 [Gammaproteobacteria bacterium 45_16_T64]
MIENRIDLNTGEGYIVLRPNLSMSTQRALWVYSALSLYCLAIGVYFAIIGVWFVLPFSGLEIITLLVTAYMVRRRLSRQEVLRFSAGEVLIESGVKRADQCWKISRPWSSALVSKSERRNIPKRVLICFRTESREVGGFLVENERDELVQLLVRVLPVRYKTAEVY